jgi:DNA invertase Pin-like site-specific DNA recombinase
LKIGYARVSTSGQSLESQVAALESAGCEEIFREKLSGKSAEARVQLQAALAMCRKNDVLVTTKLDRLARSMVDLWNIINRLEQKKCALTVLDQPLIDTTKPEGKVVVSLLAYVAETERNLILERTASGRTRAKERGVKFGRKASLSSVQLDALKQEAAQWKGSVSELGRKHGLSRSSVYRLLGSTLGELVPC